MPGTCLSSLMAAPMTVAYCAWLRKGGVDGQQTLHGHRLRLRVFDDALAAVTAPEAGLLEAAHGAGRGPRGSVGLVDVDAARLDAGRQLAGAARLAREDAGVEAVVG